MCNCNECCACMILCVCVCVCVSSLWWVLERLAIEYRGLETKHLTIVASPRFPGDVICQKLDSKWS